jgi:nitrogen fixation-related uncharacterized protein
LVILGLFAWALHAGQFDALEHEGARMFEKDRRDVDQAQGDDECEPEESTSTQRTIDG